MMYEKKNRDISNIPFFIFKRGSIRFCCTGIFCEEVKNNYGDLVHAQFPFRKGITASWIETRKKIPSRFCRFQLFQRYPCGCATDKSRRGMGKTMKRESKLLTVRWYDCPKGKPFRFGFWYMFHSATEKIQIEIGGKL